MIKNVIFDIGKVLVSYEPTEYMKSLGLDEDAIDAINGAMFENKLWEESDQGLYTPEECLAKFIEGAPKYEAEIRQIHATVGKTIELYPYVMDWLKELKDRGYKLYILSNYSENMLNQTKDKLKFLSLVDGTVFSYKCKLMKPSGKIYEYLCQKYSLNCSECVFVDDRIENVEGAQRNGIVAVHFRDFKQAKADLEEMLRY